MVQTLTAFTAFSSVRHMFSVHCSFSVQVGLVRLTHSIGWPITGQTEIGLRVSCDQNLEVRCSHTRRLVLCFITTVNSTAAILLTGEGGNGQKFTRFCSPPADRSMV